MVSLDQALRRGEAYLKAGADGLFIEAPLNEEETRTIDRHFDVPLMANMLEGGRTPILKPAQLEELGFRLVIYGISLLMRITRTMQEALADIASDELNGVGTGVGFEDCKTIVGMFKW